MGASGPAAIPILYEDNHLLVVVKPVNVPSQEDDTGDPDMLTLLKTDLKHRYSKPGNVYLGLVHRLDRPVGGVMAFAKTSKAASRLSDQIRTRAFDKTYLAVVHGKPPRSGDRLVHYLAKDSKHNRVSVVSRGDREAKEAILDYEVIGEGREGMSLVQVKLLTGRPHQIRVQLAAIGCPLYGDQKYGSQSRPGQQIALWSASLSFLHPTSREALTFASAPPETTPWTSWSRDLERLNLDAVPLERQGE